MPPSSTDLSESSLRVLPSGWTIAKHFHGDHVIVFGGQDCALLQDGSVRTVGHPCPVTQKQESVYRHIHTESQSHSLFFSYTSIIIHILCVYCHVICLSVGGLERMWEWVYIVTAVVWQLQHDFCFCWWLWHLVVFSLYITMGYVHIWLWQHYIDLSHYSMVCHWTLILKWLRRPGLDFWKSVCSGS